MRAKKAKALRLMARRVTEGLPNRRLIWSDEKRTNAINDPRTTRGVYRKWKKLAVKGRTVFKDA